MCLLATTTTTYSHLQVALQRQRSTSPRVRARPLVCSPCPSRTGSWSPSLFRRHRTSTRTHGCRRHPANGLQPRRPAHLASGARYVLHAMHGTREFCAVSNPRPTGTPDSPPPTGGMFEHPRLTRHLLVVEKNGNKRSKAREKRLHGNKRSKAREKLLPNYFSHFFVQVEIVAPSA